MIFGVKNSKISQVSAGPTPSIEQIRDFLGVDLTGNGVKPESLPFGLNDVTAGSETELQAAVMGDRDCVDLPIRIKESNYFANIIRRAASGDTSERAITDLEEYLSDNPDSIWENSWVRFPVTQMTIHARKVFAHDLLQDKKKVLGSLRSDAHKFVYSENGQEFVRVPISYVMKLALADAISSQKKLPEIISVTGTRLMNHLLNDNTSPETFSFHVVPIRSESGLGRSLAKETSKRYLFTQLLVMYANRKFLLETSGQKALLYFSPHPPIRQKKLNDCISDSFYRELFMSPCLNGWEAGQKKHDYMCLCHQVLSRSQLNAVAKLREAGIITRNLVVLPNVSNISLANNGIHVSLGSARLTAHLAAKSSQFTSEHEKFLGDLVIKIVEHFLPLFVGTYSGAPYRLGFSDFHPERALSFLPHELDYTHLRMIWRRWKKKAGLKIFGQPCTPFGVPIIDRALTLVFRLKGDFVPDFRLIDYLISVMSTSSSPALDGTQGNLDRLKKDLADLGVFDENMSPYLLYRLREFSKMGFSGFEGRYYSLFGDMENDMAKAVDMQILVTALAFKLIFQGSVNHGHIPDDPFVESERRQVFFGSAIGIPTFYVKIGTSNLFLKKILERTRGLRPSRRYQGYMRVYNSEYLLGLTKFIRDEAPDLIEMFGLRNTVDDLLTRLRDSNEYSASGRLTRSILETLAGKSPLKEDAEDFNRAAERYYRTELKIKHLVESLNFLGEDIAELESEMFSSKEPFKEALSYTLREKSLKDFFESARRDVLSENASTNVLIKLINLVIITVYRDCEKSSGILGSNVTYDSYAPPVCRARNRDSQNRKTFRG
jgi:hypothetical protein